MDDSSSNSLPTTSLRSGSSNQNIVNDGLIHVYIYNKGNFEKFSPTLLCEEICTEISHQLGILPMAQLLFGLRQQTSSNKKMRAEQFMWALPGDLLNSRIQYCFRMRFKVPELDRQLDQIDVASHKYLYHQMRYDMLHEHIPELRYPNHKSEVMGLAVMDMQIDKVEIGQPTERHYKKYLPSSLLRAHRFFVRPRIHNAFRDLSVNPPNVEDLKWHYVHQIYNLAPSYLTEQFKAKVEYLPNEESFCRLNNASVASSTRTSTTTLVMASNTTLSPLSINGHHQGNSSNDTSIQRDYQQHLQTQDKFIDVYVKLSSHEFPEPGLKVARVTSEATLKWTLVAAVEDIFTVYKESNNVVRLESPTFPKGYRMIFNSEAEMKSFISYLGNYIRLTGKWMQDLCASYKTPMLEELERLYCHGPIGGSYSFMKLHKNGDKYGSYIVRQCDREYNTYYIDINTKKSKDHERCQAESFKIERRGKQWILFFNKGKHTFDQLEDLANFIPVENHIRIPPSKFDKPPLLLLCLPKNLKTKKTDTELSESELLRRNPQIFNPTSDLQWYLETVQLSDDGKVYIIRGDWTQQGSIKDVPVTLKKLRYEADVQDFLKLAQTWSLIQSPQFIKLYGLTLSEGYTMVMEYAEHGPLNKFLQKNQDITMHCLLDLMHGLVRGIHYLKDNGIIHWYIRCANLYVTKYDKTTHELVAKISDPGYPRKYNQSDLPWIPTEYYNKLEDAKKDSSTQLWAFATTVWEIFSRGEVVSGLKQMELIRNRNVFGGILKPLSSELCPSEMDLTIMDGWSEDPEKRFDHQKIFNNLNAIKNRRSPEDTEVSINGTIKTCNSTTQCANDDNGSSHINSFTNNELIGATRLGSEIFSKDLKQVIALSECKVIYREKNKIGEGHYGTVYRGEIVFNDSNRPTEQVAIKKLKAMEVTSDFLREMDIMRTLDHINVVKLKYWAKKSHCIIMELFDLGSFREYLRSHTASLTNLRLLEFALDIARGMEYLSGKGLIHRDLAARNILVDRACVKISDFGLAQFANADGYYIGTSIRDLPVMWYSPEAIATSKFSSHSDVWSYGVTLFEMFSRGEEPYLSNNTTLTHKLEFLTILKNGTRLPKPHQCPDSVYIELMRPCWHEAPKARPTFGEIISIIQQEIAKIAASTTCQQQQRLEQQQL